MDEWMMASSWEGVPVECAVEPVVVMTSGGLVRTTSTGGLVVWYFWSRLLEQERRSVSYFLALYLICTMYNVPLYLLWLKFVFY